LSGRDVQGGTGKRWMCWLSVWYVLDGVGGGLTGGVCGVSGQVVDGRLVGRQKRFSVSVQSGIHWCGRRAVRSLCAWVVQGRARGGVMRDMRAQYVLGNDGLDLGRSLPCLPREFSLSSRLGKRHAVSMSCRLCGSRWGRLHSVRAGNFQRQHR
jgi:hypothetical protein